MYKKIRTRIIELAGVFLIAFLICGCGKQMPVSGERANQNEPQKEQAEAGEDRAQEEDRMQEENGTQEENDTQEDEKNARELAEGEVSLKQWELTEYATGQAALDEKEPDKIVYLLTMPLIPKSDDTDVYLFAKECYEDTGNLTGEPIASCRKGRRCEISVDYEKRYLFTRFIPALMINGKYMRVGKGVYLNNPEILAENQEAFPETDSKKGLLLDPAMLGKAELTDLGVKHAIYNFPLSAIMGQTTNQDYPTILYSYEGKEYEFNGAAINSYDGLFTYLTGQDMCTTAVVLNDWNENFTQMIHPGARNREGGALYYMFNTREEEGTKMLEATACFLAERYSGKEHGTVSNWVIANEINQHKTWNYLDTKDIVYYAGEFEKAFRIFYQAIKSNYANAGVYFSIDHEWNSNGGHNRVYFNGREMIEQFNAAAGRHGNYDWGIAIHPYPDPLTRVNYWSLEYDKTPDAKLLTIMNLNVLTDFLEQEEYLNPNGQVRKISITELGFSSRFGEKLQAAAFAYCYYIVEANPYVEALILSRQTDAPEEVVQGLALGIYEYDGSEKFLKDIFRYIDTEQSSEYTEFMLNILGAESIEEALSWAK